MIFVRVPAMLGYRDLVTRAVATACKVAGGQEATDSSVGEQTVSELVSAVGEAFNNAVLHAYPGRSGGSVAVEIEANDREIAVSVADEGQSFDFDAVPEPDLAALPESGMGIFIIRSFMDEVLYTPGSPNVLLMRKRL